MSSTSESVEPASRYVAVGAWLAALGVALGAFGAHALQGRVSAARLDVWETAVLYHLLHALGLVAYGLWRRQAGGSVWPGHLMLAGIGVFSGSLYALVLLDLGILGAVTPVGGVCLIASWLIWGWSAWRGA